MTRRQWLIVLIKSLCVGAAVGWFFSYRSLYLGITFGLIAGAVFLGTRLILKLTIKRKITIGYAEQNVSKGEVTFSQRYWRPLLAILILSLVLGTFFLFDVNKGGHLSLRNISLPELLLYLIVFLVLSVVFFIRLK